MDLPENFCIVSGGQTGADRAALDFAIAKGIAYDGWCPRGRLAEDGPLPEQYKLKETPSQGYPQRTKWNVRDTDATLVITLSPVPSGGTALTVKIAEDMEKPLLHICQFESDSLDQSGQDLLAFIEEHKVVRLNIAGPRASLEPKISEFVQAVLNDALAESPTLDL
jgi:hypothetical protein